MDIFKKVQITTLEDWKDNLPQRWLDSINQDKHWPLQKPSIRKTAKIIQEDIWILLELTTNEIKEKIESSTLLSDFFQINTDWKIEVKSVENSNWIKWHFSNLPIVPWVLLKKLFKVISWLNIKHNWFESVDFEYMVIPWDKISVKSDWLYVNDKRVMSIKTDFDINDHRYTTDTSLYNSDVSLIENYDLSIIPSHSLEQEIDEFLFQKPPFRFATNCDLYLDNWDLIQVWDVIKWSYIIPNDLQYIDEKLNIDSDLFPEISAQILSFWASYILNKWITNDNRKKLLTFANSTTITYPLPEKIWNIVFVEYEVTDITDKEILWKFKLRDWNWYVLQEWSIKWWVTIKRAVWFMHWSKTNKNKK